MKLTAILIIAGVLVAGLVLGREVIESYKMHVVNNALNIQRAVDSN